MAQRSAEAPSFPLAPSAEGVVAPRPGIDARGGQGVSDGHLHRPVRFAWSRRCARSGGRVDPPGLRRSQVGWCLPKTPRKSPRFGPRCDSDRRSGRPRAGQGSGPCGRSRPCRQPPVVGAGVPFPGVGIRLRRPALRCLGWSTLRRCDGLRGASFGWGRGRGGRKPWMPVQPGGAGRRASPRRPWPPSRSLVSPDVSLSLTPALRPRLMRVLGRAPPAATPASPSRRARAPVMTGEAPPVRTAP